MLAIIPARCGSKGLPDKNIKSLNGKPMIAYTIEAARQASRVSRVIVSTDCENIARQAIEYGAEVPFLRPRELASDQSLAIETYLYMFERLGQGGYDHKREMVVLLPTCPLRNHVDIDAAIELFLAKRADSVVSYTREKHPVTWHHYVDSDGKLQSIFSEKMANRQDEEVSYYPNGAIFIFREELLKQGTYYSDNSYAYLMPGERSIDVDTLEDFQYVEFLMGKSSDV